MSETNPDGQALTAAPAARHEPMWNTKTCGQCGHFDKMGGEPNGYCCRYPDAVLGNGSIQRQPVVKEKHRACGEFTSEAPPTNRVKANPETPGQAAKAARQERRA